MIVNSNSSLLMGVTTSFETLKWFALADWTLRHSEKNPVTYFKDEQFLKLVLFTFSPFLKAKFEIYCASRHTFVTKRTFEVISQSTAPPECQSLIQIQISQLTATLHSVSPAFSLSVTFVTLSHLSACDNSYPCQQDAAERRGGLCVSHTHTRTHALHQPQLNYITWSLD